MREVMTKSMARNIFYGGSLFFLVIFLLLTYQSRRYIVTESTNAETLTASRELADYYEQAVAALPSQPKLIANWVNGELAAGLNQDNISITDSPVTAAMLGKLVARIDDNTISGKIAKEVFEAIWNGEGNADEIIEKRGLKQISDDSAIEPVIDEILANNPNQIEQYKGGNTKLLGFFVGQVMKATQGKANPKQVNELLRKKLGD